MTTSRIFLETDNYGQFYVHKSGKQEHFRTYWAAREHVEKLAKEMTGQVDFVDLVPIERRGNA